MEDPENTKNVQQKKKMVLQIDTSGAGFGVVLLLGLGGVLASAALSSAFFARKRGRSREERNKSPPPAIEQDGATSSPSPEYESCRSDKGISSGDETVVLASHQSLNLDERNYGIEMIKDTPRDVPTRPNEQLVCVMRKVEDGGAECSIDKIQLTRDDWADQNIKGSGDTDINASSGDDKGVKMDNITGHLVSNQSSTLDGTSVVEISGGTLEEVSSRLDEQFICIMRKSENGDAECSVENVQFETPIIEFDGGKLDDASSQPNGDFVCIMRRGENCNAECSVEKIQSLRHENGGIEFDDGKQDDAPSLEAETPYDEPSQPNEQFVCIMRRTENGDAECSTEKIQLLEAAKTLNVEFNGGTPHDEPSPPNEQFVCIMRRTENGDAECSTEKIQSLEAGETLNIEFNGGTSHDAPSQPNEQFVCIMRRTENGDAECSTEKIQSFQNETLGIEFNGTSPNTISTQPIEQLGCILRKIENGNGECFNGGSSDDFSSQPNEQFVCIMRKGESGDAECSVEKIQLPKDELSNQISTESTYLETNTSDGKEKRVELDDETDLSVSTRSPTQDETQGNIDTNGYILYDVSSRPNGHLACVMRRLEDQNVECTIEKIQNIQDGTPGVELDDCSSGASEQFVCVMRQTQNGDGECSIEKVQLPEEETSDENSNQFKELEINASLGTEKSAESYGEIGLSSTLDETSGTEVNGNVPTPPNEQFVCVMRKAENGYIAECSVEKIQLPKEDAKDLESIRDEVEDGSTNSSQESISASIWPAESLPEEVEREVQEDTLLKQVTPDSKDTPTDDSRHDGNLHNIATIAKALDGEINPKNIPMKRSDLGLAASSTKRRMLMGLLSVISSLAISSLFDLSFLKLCLIFLLTVVLSEIHG